METSANQPPELTPCLREFLAEPARDEAWRRPAGTADLAESDFQVAEQLLGESDTRFVPEGGLRLNRVTYLPLSPDDVPALAGYRAGLAEARLVLAMFWFMLTELPAKRSYDTVRIMIKLQPPAPVLLLSPDAPDGPGPAWQGLAAELADAVESLLRAGSRLAATGLDHGDDGFGWKYEARAGAPLTPRRITTVVVLELPRAVTGLDGVLDAEAQISRAVLGKAFPRTATLVNSAVPFHVPFVADTFVPDTFVPEGGEPRAQPHGHGHPQRPSAAGYRGKQRARSSPPDRYDLGMIVPLREEFDCAREIFSFERQVTSNGSYLYPFTVPGSSLRGVAVVLYGMGPTMTGVQAANLLDRFEIPVLALIGIAGALDGDLRLGDVVVASVVDPYLDRAKARPGSSGAGFDLDSGGSAWRAGRDLVSFANNFRYRGDEPDECAGWRSRGGLRREAARLPADGALARAEPDYTVAPVASGDIVGASVEFARWLRSHHRQCAALEMEAGGVAQAVYEHGGTDMVIVRGISDFADERKQALDATGAVDAGRGAWRRYAALNAADLLATMLRNPGFPWPS